MKDLMMCLTKAVLIVVIIIGIFGLVRVYQMLREAAWAYDGTRLP